MESISTEWFGTNTYVSICSCYLIKILYISYIVILFHLELLDVLRINIWIINKPI